MFERKGDGYLVRKRVTVKATGRFDEMKKVLPEATFRDAIKWQEDQSERRHGGTAAEPRPRQRFADFAVSIFERR
jgi:hypothetical protein